jgi:hypothetical protein
MNHETYLLALKLLEVMDTDRDLRDATEVYGSWYDHLVDHMTDYEKENYDQVQLLKTLNNQLNET